MNRLKDIFNSHSVESMASIILVCGHEHKTLKEALYDNNNGSIKENRLYSIIINGHLSLVVMNNRGSLRFLCFIDKRWYEFKATPKHFKTISEGVTKEYMEGVLSQYKLA